MWFKVDDGWARHAKTRKAGKDGRALWMIAGTECAAAKTDGHVAAHLLRDYAYFAEVNATKASALLVGAGLWHDADSIVDCDECFKLIGPIEDGAFYFHDWGDWQPTRDEQSTPTNRLRWQRKNALKRNRDLCERIVQRDRNQCRYCRTRVNWSDRRGNTGGTYDHVDPDGDNALENVVVACRKCNIRKGGRTPAEASMELLPPPEAPGPDQIRTRSGPDGPSPKSGSDLALGARHAREGTDPDRTESGSGRTRSARTSARGGAGGDGQRPGAKSSTTEGTEPS